MPARDGAGTSLVRVLPALLCLGRLLRFGSFGCRFPGRFFRGLWHISPFGLFAGSKTKCGETLVDTEVKHRPMAARQLIAQPHISDSVYVVLPSWSTELVRKFRDITYWIPIPRPAITRRIGPMRARFCVCRRGPDHTSRLLRAATTPLSFRGRRRIAARSLTGRSMRWCDAITPGFFLCARR
jgi:hypothetical protein